MTEAALAAHRAFYDAVETGDVDLMASLWIDSAETSCVHPGSPPLRGTPAVLRSWTVVMAGVGYVQFFLTDVEVLELPPGAEETSTVVVTCTENILSGDGSTSDGTLVGSKAVCTSILVRDPLRGEGHTPTWKFWSRHASPILERSTDPDPEDSP